MHRFLSAMLLGLALMLTGISAQAATVKVSVNGVPITDVQISQRLALHRIEGKNNAQAAQEELINEALQLQEADRLGLKVSESEVDSAVLDVARQIKVSASNLEDILTSNGVPMQTLRDRLRANIAWSRVTAQVVSARVQVSEADIDAQAKAKLTAANSFDYILKEVLFLMPGGKGNASQRSAQANQYRQAFKGCDSAVELTLSYTDAAVRDLGRRHATQLPDALSDELSKLNVGGITKPRVVEGAVSMLAICSKSTSEDTTFIANNIRQDAGNNGLKAEADKYLAELRAKAQILRS